MKSSFILILIAFNLTSSFCQTVDKKQILGKWKLEKITISPEMFFDNNDKDSTRRNFLRQYKEKKYSSSWTFQDSLTVEMLYKKAMADIEQMFIEFKNDGTYLTNGFNHAEGNVEGTERGTFVFNAKTMDLTFFKEKKKTNVTELKVIKLDVSTLIVTEKGTSRQFPILIYRRAK